MNLHDIVKRKDPIMTIESGSIQPAHRAGEKGFVGAQVGPNTLVRFIDASQFTALRLGAPLGWQVVEGDASIELSSDEIIVRSDTGGLIKSGTWWEPRSFLLPYAIGEGLEVGPGQNPNVKNSATTQVRYLEDVDKDEWLARYHVPPGPETDAMWQNYVVGDAQRLEGFGEGALDFIYSSHVFEHLMNPLGVLAGWSACLKKGGSVLAVVPDCRYCFDLRQAPSTLAEFEAEFASGQWKPGREKYEKWCAGTARGSDPESMIERRYPIHFHYYTPSVFGQLASKAFELGLFSEFDLWSDPNAKDFAIRLLK